MMRKLIFGSPPLDSQYKTTNRQAKQKQHPTNRTLERTSWTTKTSPFVAVILVCHSSSLVVFTLQTALKLQLKQTLDRDTQHYRALGVRTNWGSRARSMEFLAQKKCDPRRDENVSHPTDEVKAMTWVWNQFRSPARSIMSSRCDDTDSNEWQWSVSLRIKHGWGEAPILALISDVGFYAVRKYPI